jgi:hypothetical protein
VALLLIFRIFQGFSLKKFRLSFFLFFVEDLNCLILKFFIILAF